MHPAIDMRRHEVDNIPQDFEERKAGPGEEAKERFLNLMRARADDIDEIESEDSIDELDEDEIDRLLQTAHDPPERQPDECARVEQSHR